MFSKILLVYNLLFLDLINLLSIFESDSHEKLIDKIPHHLIDYHFYLICKLQPNGYNCSDGETKASAKFYFDINMRTCMTFEYGDCNFSHNKFNTLDDCSKSCFESMQQDTNSIKKITNNLLCRLQPEFGNCQTYHPMYYFDVTTRTCQGFSYSGCGGNMNRFLTEKMCKELCTGAVSIPTKAVRHNDEHSNPWEI